MNWKARTQSGGIYCSPACGARCRQAAYDRAKVESAALAKRLGQGWQPVVWENMGWYWSVEKCGLSLRQTYRGSTIIGDYRLISRYTCYFNNDVRQVVTDGRTPESPIEKAIIVARDYVHKLQFA